MLLKSLLLLWRTLIRSQLANKIFEEECENSYLVDLCVIGSDTFFGICPYVAELLPLQLKQHSV